MHCSLQRCSATSSPSRDGSGSSGLSRFLRGFARTDTGHLGIAAAALLSAIAAATAYPQGAVQIVLTGMVLHGYPVMIQHIMRFIIIMRFIFTNRRTSISRNTC